MLGTVRVEVRAAADLGDERAVGPRREAVDERVAGGHVEVLDLVRGEAVHEHGERAQRVAVPDDEDRLAPSERLEGRGPEGAQPLDDVRERLGVGAQGG